MAAVRASLAAGVAILMLAASGAGRAASLADAGRAWALGRLLAMRALPPSIEAAQENAWLVIPQGDQRNNHLPESVYEAEIAPQMDQLAAIWLPTLRQQLTARLHAVTYAAVDAMHAARTEISYCHWIRPTHKDGRIGPPPLAARLFATCRSEAPRIITGLLVGHADALDLSLPGLPRLDLTYPGWFTADLGRADGDSPAALDSLHTRQAYVDRLRARLQAAEPGLERRLDDHHAAQRWGGERLDAPKDTCAALLGPLQAGAEGPAEYDAVRQALTAHCIKGASARLMALLPRILAALPGALAARMPPDGPLRSQRSLCYDALGAWLGQGDDPPGFRQTLDTGCAPKADALVADAIDRRVERFAAPLLALPWAVEALQDHAWFGLTAPQLENLTVPDDPDPYDLVARVLAGFTARVAPAATAGAADGQSRIAAAYDRAAGSAAAYQEVLRLCGPDGTGAGLPAPGRGGEVYHDRIVSACSVGQKAFPKARITLAQARAGVAADAPVQLLMPSADGEVAAKFVDLVARAALAGVQLRISPGTLGFRRSLIASPMGLDTPALTGPVAQVREGWRLSAFDQLPGWPADPAATIACLASPEGAVTDAQFEAIFILFAAFAAADDDRPRTAHRGFTQVLERLRQAGAMHACQDARRKFLGQTGL